MSRFEVQENSAKSFTIRFLNSSKALSAPASARWRLKHMPTGQIVVNWVDIPSPSSEETITINANQNIIRSGRDEEMYELAVQSDYNDANQKQTRAIQYRVINISSVD